MLPFMACMALAVALIVAFPEIALWLPDLVKGRKRGRLKTGNTNTAGLTPNLPNGGVREAC